MSISINCSVSFRVFGLNWCWSSRVSGGSVKWNWGNWESLNCMRGVKPWVSEEWTWTSSLRREGHRLTSDGHFVSMLTLSLPLCPPAEWSQPRTSLWNRVPPHPPAGAVRPSNYRQKAFWRDGFVCVRGRALGGPGSSRRGKSSTPTRSSVPLIYIP